MKLQIRSRKEINETKTKKKFKINKNENWLLENINKRDKPLARFTKKKEREDSKSETREKTLQMIPEIKIRDYHE